MVGSGVRNPVVLTGDVHRSWAANLMNDYAAQDRVVGTVQAYVSRLRGLLMRRL